jgi:hypothetical protein
MAGDLASVRQKGNHPDENRGILTWVNRETDDPNAMGRPGGSHDETTVGDQKGKSGKYCAAMSTKTVAEWIRADAGRWP